MADKIGHSEAETRTELKKVSEVLAGFLEDILMNWRSEPPKSRFGRLSQYFVAWLGAFHFSFPAFLTSYATYVEGFFPQNEESSLLMAGLVFCGVYSVLPALLIGPNVKRQTSVRIFLAGFFFTFTTWALIGRFASGGS